MFDVSNVLFHSSEFEKEAPASILAAILTTRVLFAEKIELGVMCGKHRLANHIPVNNAYKCTIDRGVPVNSHCVGGKPRGGTFSRSGSHMF